MESWGTGSFVAELSSFTQDYNHEAHPHQYVDQQSVPFMVCLIFLYGYHTLGLSTFLQWIISACSNFWLLWIKQLGILLYLSSAETHNHIPQVELRVRLLGPMFNLSRHL